MLKIGDICQIKYSFHDVYSDELCIVISINEYDRGLYQVKFLSNRIKISGDGTVSYYSSDLKNVLNNKF